MPAGVVPYALSSAYELLIESLEEAAASANCGFVRRAAPILECFSREEDGTIGFDCILHLQDWAARGSRIHILLHAEETIRGSGSVYILERSTVRLNYYRLQDESAYLLQGLHFDHGPLMRRHPIFHAQLTNEIINLSSSAAEELEFKMEQMPCSACFREARIPTADMTLPSVLLCLAADHFGQNFSSFLEEVRRIQGRLPQPTIEPTKTSISRSSDLRSSHWFAHEP